jgi:hypothetical protein
MHGQEGKRNAHLRGTMRTVRPAPRGPEFRAGGVVISGYSSPLYGELYDGWYHLELSGYTGNSQDGKAQRTEVLWSNRPFAQGSLFDQMESA